MKLFDILKKVGSVALRTMVSISGPIIDAVNMFLPEDKKLPSDATGDQVNRAVDTLPPEQQAQLLSKEYDVEIAEITSWTQIQSSLAEADKVGASTRPKIALMMAWIVCYAEIIAISMWGYAVIKNQVSLENSWPLIVAILATPIALLRAYFGMRSKEKKGRYNAAAGQPAQSNLLTNIIKTIRG